MKRGYMACILLGAAFILTGCSSFSPEVSGISIDKKGGITEVSRESFEQSYYNKEELESEIDAEVESYNAKAGEKAVRKKSFRVKDSTAQLRMTYKTAEDYADFNGVDLYVGDIQGAVQAGYTFEGEFYEVVNGVVRDDKPIFGSQIMTGKNYSTVAVREAMLIQVPGTIRYVSTNVKLSDKDTAVVEQKQAAYILYE